MVSIITITFNRAHVIDDTIKSVLAQTNQDFEFIVVDDGSTDNTEQLVARITDPRFFYHKVDHVGHLSKLRNIGIARSKGDIIAFIDSDDLWNNNYLEKLIAMYKDIKIDYLISNADFLIEKEIVKHDQFKMSLLKQNNSARILKQKLSNNIITIYASCFSYRRSKINLFLNEKLRVGDNDFFLKIIANYEGCLIDETLVIIRKHENNMSELVSYDSSYIQAYYEDIATLNELFKDKKIPLWLFLKASSRNYYQLGNNLTSIGIKRQATYAYLKSFALNVLNIKAFLKMLISIFA